MPDNIPIEQKAGLFYKIKLKGLFYKAPYLNDLSSE